LYRESNLSILHLSDIHVDYRDVDSNGVSIYEKWDSLLLEIKQKKIEFDFVVISGDIIFYSDKKKNFRVTKQLLDKLLKTINLSDDRLIVCIGNHDIFFSDITDTPQFDFSSKYKEMAEDFIIFYSHYSLVADQIYSIKEFGDTTFLILNGLYNFKDEMFYYDDKCIEKILEEFKKISSKYKFIVNHSGLEFINSDILKNFMKKEDIFLLCGHKGSNIKSGLYKTESLPKELISYSKEGFIDENLKYNIYDFSTSTATISFLSYTPSIWSVLRER
jgi:uncharacterized protein YlzI (FlbEa/FlbD family)